MSNMTSTATPPIVQPRRSRRLLHWVAGILGGLILVALVAVGAMIVWMNYVPSDLDTSTILMTEQGIYRVGYTPQFDPVPVNQMQSWTLHVETPDGKPVENATITVDGDMPQHGHGLPTRPQVTKYLGNGDYQVEGLKFHMPGWWVMDFVITANGQTDKVRFNMLLK